MRRLNDLLCLLVFLGLFAFAEAVSYTVQVVAISDETNALNLQEDLRAMGYPAYLVSVPTSSGYIFRLRVGSFANRAAAAKFAVAMASAPETIGSSPAPALAEGIPLDLVPLEAELLGSYPLTSNSVQVLPWRGDITIRTQAVDSWSEAVYLFRDLSSFTAWRAASLGDGSFVRVYNKELWPEAWQIASSEEREAYRLQTLEEVSSEIDLPAESLRAFEFRSQEGLPFLVMVEKVDPATGERRTLRSLGQPSSGISAYGPELVWFSGETEISMPVWLPIYEPDLAIQDSVNEPLIGNEWEVLSDGSYALVIDDTSHKSWRAAAGQPVWAEDNLLMTRYKDEVQLYLLKRLNIEQ